MPDVKRTIKVITEQKVIPGADSGVEGFPLRHWTIKVVLLDQDKSEVDADIFDTATYILHESFGPKARQVIKKPPFRVSEDGWGEFELSIVLTDAAGKDHTLIHDLNFQQQRYEVKHVINFKNPKAPLLPLLRNSGPIPGESTASAANGADGKKRAGETGTEGRKEKKKKPVGEGKGIDMDRLAEGLQKLGEDDLLQVVQMVHDNKSEESWMRNDVDQGEFHVDLYTLPDNLIKMLWDFTNERNSLTAVA